MKTFSVIIGTLCLVALMSTQNYAQKQPEAEPVPESAPVPHIEVVEEEHLIGIGYDNIFCQDPSLPEGKMEVLFDGQVGQAVQVSQVTYTDGRITAREEISRTELKTPVSAIVAIGTGESVGSERKFPLFGQNTIITADGKVLTYSHVDRFLATAYTAGEPGVDHTTAMMTDVHVGVVAVDPRVIPYFTKMYIVTEDGAYIYGESSAEDCGGGIKNKRIDLYFDTLYECNQFGVRYCQVYFLT